MDNLPFDANAIQILEKRYLQRDKDGNIVETPRELFERVADTVSSVEKERDRETWREVFFNMMWSKQFLPNSPTLVNAGTNKGSLSACFVMSPEDTMESIMQVAYDSALVEKWGGGIGFNLSHLRPKNDSISTTHGKALGPVGVMRIYAKLGTEITQGGFRLGAHMAMLSVDHPDIREFIHCKDDVRNNNELSNFNISVRIPDSFMLAVESGDDWPLFNPRNGEIVETVNASELWDEICQSAWETGDPGLGFMDRVMETHPNPQLDELTSNPCITGDTLVYTSNGLIPIEELVGKTSDLVLRDAENGFTPSVWCSGTKPVYRLITKEGYTLKLTEDHEIYTTRGKVAAKALQRGDEIQILDHKGGFGTGGSRKLGLVLGWLAGDGHFTGDKAVLNFYGQDRELSGEFAKCVSSLVEDLGERTWRKYTITSCPIEERDCETITSTRLKMLCDSYGINKDTKHCVPDVVYRGTEDMQSAYLSALFGADGTVGKSGKTRGTSVRLASSYPDFCEGVQRLLLNFGIASKIYKRREAQYRMMPDGKGGQKEYWTKANYEVCITKDNIVRFKNEIGFYHVEKNQTLEEEIALYSRGPFKETFLVGFSRLEYLGEKEVYDLTERDSHSFIANGITISNCGEQMLENYNSCNLGSINLYQHLNKTKTGIDYDTLGSTVHVAVRFLDNVVSVNTFPVEKIADMNSRTRRIGLGVMGWADVLMALDIPYNSQVALSLAEEIASFIKESAWTASIIIAQQKGPFPEFEYSALKEMGMLPVRNSCITNTAPTGTISRIAGCSSGIEPYFALAYTSNVLWEDQNGTTTTLYDVPQAVRDYLEECLTAEDVERFLRACTEGDKTVMSYYMHEYSMDYKLLNSTALMISPEDHINMQAVWQKHGNTNATSKTINLKESESVSAVKNAYNLAWETGCKGITVYRQGSRDIEVLNTGKTEEKSIIPKEQWIRPDSLQSVTTKKNTGHGALYITEGYQEQVIREVFLSMGKAGGCESANMEAVARLVSIALQYNVPKTVIVKQLEGITCCPAWDKGVLVKSPMDALANLLKEEIDGNVLALETTGFSCPECNSELISESGCFNCPKCGYSKCG